jgi:hypothetical protein
MLRTVVVEGGQQVLREVPVCRFPVSDLRESTDADASMLAIREELSDRSFEPAQWPLFDVRLSLLPNEGARLHFAIDLLIADASSLLLLFHEWMTLYRQGRSALPPLELTFRDYVLAQTDLRTHPRYQQSLAFWRAQVGQLPPPPELPLAKDPAAVTRPRFRRRSRTLDAATWSALPCASA